MHSQELPRKHDSAVYKSALVHVLAWNSNLKYKQQCGPRLHDVNVNSSCFFTIPSTGRSNEMSCMFSVFLCAGIFSGFIEFSSILRKSWIFYYAVCEAVRHLPKEGATRDENRGESRRIEGESRRIEENRGRAPRIEERPLTRIEEEDSERPRIEDRT